MVHKPLIGSTVPAALPHVARRPQALTRAVLTAAARRNVNVRKDVPSSVAKVSVASLIIAKKIPYRDSLPFVSPELVMAVSPHVDGDIGQPIADGAAYLPDPGFERIEPWLNEYTTTCLDPRANAFLASAIMQDGYKGRWVPITTPASPAALQMCEPLLAWIETWDRKVVMRDVEVAAVRADAMRMWTEMHRGVRDGVEFLREFIPDGTKAVKAPQVGQRTASRLLAQTQDPSQLAAWINAATVALRASNKALAALF